ncbi:MAG: GrpB family protein [Armatimonadota bacterium]
MNLSGQIKPAGTIWSMDEYGSLFGLLRSEIRYPDAGSRYIGFEAFNDGTCVTRFLGADTAGATNIPGHLTALECGDRELVVTLGSSIQRYPIEWMWQQHGMGEFRMMTPTEWSGLAEPTVCDWRLSSLAAFDVSRDYQDDVELVNYNPDWPDKFLKYAKEIITAIGDIQLRVEHYGSTSIPGMPAKPVIDILVEIPSFKWAHQVAIPALCNDCCEYWSFGGHMCFVKRDTYLGSRCCHIHMAPAEHPIWVGLAFRDYLRNNPEEADRYAALKYELAQQHTQDREAYTQAKTDYVQRVTGLALQTP